MAKKICLEIAPFFPTKENFRGPYIYDQVKAIKENSKFEVIVIKLLSLYDKNQVQQYNYQGITVYNFVVYDLPSSILPGLFQFINLIRLERFIKEVIGIQIKDISYIHTHVIYPAGMLGVAFGKKNGITNFIQHHGLDVFQKENGKILKGVLRKLNNCYMYRKFINIVNSTDLNIGVSQKVINQLENIEGFVNSKVYVLHNGIDTTKFYKKEDVDKSSDFTVGCIGNFWPLKDQMTLLKAVNILVQDGQKINVKFVGSGPTHESCKDYVSKNHLESFVEFLSEIDHTQLNDFYNSLNLFVLPSYYEAFGCVYTEALQVGIPIIAVKGQGIEEVIHDEDREDYLIDKGDFVYLAELISRQMVDRKSVDYNLNINRYVKRFLGLLEDHIDS